MRHLKRPVTTSSSVAVPTKKVNSEMEYSEGNSSSDGQQPQYHIPGHSQQQGGAYPLPPESRQQPQHAHLISQPVTVPPTQQQQPWAVQQHPGYMDQRQYGRQIYPQTSHDSGMSASMVDAAAQVAYMTPQQAQHGPPQPPYMHPSYHVNPAAYTQQQYAQQMSYQQQLALQSNMQQSMVMGGHPPQQPLLHHPPINHQTHPQTVPPQQQQPQPQELHPSFYQQQQQQPKVGRLPADRPLMKLSVSLIDTYKRINTVYYEERDSRRAARAKEKTKKGQGVKNNGWDDENYDYIINPGELFYNRYRIQERIGKGSFGQVVRAEDVETKQDVAIKIIKSKKPFQMQAKTEIELLTHLNQKDPGDEHNILRLIDHFMYRDHQCLVFEMLSLNLYELLKNTQFGGVSLNLIRKFGKQVLRSLMFLAREDVDIIHCDLKPENILLRHPKKSGIKVIDFGSSCRSNKRMYSYIQSRFYRSPEVMLGLPYSTAIDMWSLGCILAEMHTGEPLFSGSDQFDQMQKIVKILGMVPHYMLDKANEQNRHQFFDRLRNRQTGKEEWILRQEKVASNSTGQSQQQPSTGRDDAERKEPIIPSQDRIASLSQVIRAETHRKKKYPPSETGNSARNYDLFVDLIHRMLTFDPLERITPQVALQHPFITATD
mmetsp:Transcript_21478/g.52919  ORF Transcript_21478/g.52919 Transcript_21478/m.52919 type:complete len:657 (+) Transcript_21478:310-2280(+)|eukprot:CAMPEP_0113608304 /NCGR_PEP_ID=MMETSP0017_2-20120614/3851_1 /TAXON_ID=2856 /ORGANISM="Cylindrotheca closterium" /LENGTH=656 /DNA_ID=CAMNT_0000516975 /DNA_START=187 /DNA_END=2157 /DNA_ORIENTATION=- /assembly_acc=CAM_ASM_000147